MLLCELDVASDPFVYAIVFVDVSVYAVVFVDVSVYAVVFVDVSVYAVAFVDVSVYAVAFVDVSVYAVAFVDVSVYAVVFVDVPVVVEVNEVVLVVVLVCCCWHTLSSDLVISSKRPFLLNLSVICSRSHSSSCFIVVELSGGVHVRVLFGEEVVRGSVVTVLSREAEVEFESEDVLVHSVVLLMLAEVISELDDAFHVDIGPHVVLHCEFEKGLSLEGLIIVLGLDALDERSGKLVEMFSDGGLDVLFMLIDVVLCAKATDKHQRWSM